MTKKKVLDYIGWGLFLLSFLPWLYLVYVSVFGGDVGLFDYDHEYGFDVLIWNAFWLSVTGILPVCLVCEVIYTIFVLRKADGIRKKIAVGLALFTVVFTILPCSLHEVKKQVDLNEFNNVTIPEVQKYLDDNFSEEFVKACEIQKPAFMNRRYNVTIRRPILGHSYLTFTVYDYDGWQDDIASELIRDYGHMDSFTEYIGRKYDIPESWQLDIMPLDIDMTDFSFDMTEEDIFDRTAYNVSSVTMTPQIYSQKQTINEIRRYYREYEGLFPADDRINFYVKMDDEYYAYIWVTWIDRDKNEIVLDFGGYTHSAAEGPTIPSEKITTKIYE